MPSARGIRAGRAFVELFADDSKLVGVSRTRSRRSLQTDLRHLPMNKRCVPAKCSLPGTSNGPASVPALTDSLLPRDSDLANRLKSSAFALSLSSSVLPTNSCTMNRTASAPHCCASPATAVKSWYLKERAPSSSGPTLSTPRHRRANRSATRLRGFRAKAMRTYSPAMSPNGSSALASMLASVFPQGPCPHSTRSALRPSPPQASKSVTRSGSPSSKTMPRVSSRDSRSDRISAGTCGSPGAGNHALASSFALRPSTHCLMPCFGGARANQSSTDRISLPLRSRSIRRTHHCHPLEASSPVSPDGTSTEHTAVIP